jgi:hypothetical protein
MELITPIVYWLITLILLVMVTNLYGAVPKRLQPYIPMGRIAIYLGHMCFIAANLILSLTIAINIMDYVFLFLEGIK